MENLNNIIEMSLNHKKPELVLKNGKIVNVFSHEIIEDDVAINDGIIIGIGSYIGKKEIDLKGKYIVPGLIDAHVHIESSMLSPKEFAKTVLNKGTTTIIADPHEIANVCGIKGIKYMLEESLNIPMNIYFMLPSCVPCTSFESSGAVLNANDLNSLIDSKRILGLGEVMNYPGVIHQDEQVLQKIKLARDKGKIIDGHGPNIKDKELNAYVVCGVKTEHECSTVDEMIDRIRLGMYIMIRQGSAAKNLETLLKGISKENLRRCVFCSDDKHPQDIVKNGHIDDNVRLAIKNGIDPISAIKMATINCAECFNLKNIGAIAPGYYADVVVVNDLNNFDVEMVYQRGTLVSEDNQILSDFESENSYMKFVTNTVNIQSISKLNLEMKLKSDIVNVISILPHSLVTKKVVRKVDVKEGKFEFNNKLDILKMVVLERHNGTSSMGLGLVENFKLKNGAIASTVAHDSHNIIAIGDNDEDILLAVETVKNTEGGIAICQNNKVLECLELPIAGLISDKSIDYVNYKLDKMINIAYEKLNVNKEIDPFMTLSFLALPVIGEIKLTDKGLFDAIKFDLINIEVENDKKC